MVDTNLTGGAIARAMRDEEVESPIFQILGFKKIAGQGGADRFRLHISDGVNTHSFAMLATQLNHLVTENRIDNFATIRVDKFICNTMNNKRIMILLQLDVLTPGSEIGRKIGNPLAWNEGGQNVPPPPQANGHANSNVNRPVANAPAQTRNENSSARPSFYGTTAEAPSPGGGQNTYNSHANRGGGGGGGDMPVTIPIRDVNPYNNKVTIRARVTHKGDIKHWSNSRGEGKLFSVDLLDDSAAIRITAFNADVDKYFDTLELDKVYFFSKFSVKAANVQFNRTGHDYELSFTSDSQVTPYMSDASDIPKITFSFVAIKDIENKNKEDIVDIVGVCQRVGDAVTITARQSGKEFTKRDIVLVDKSNTEISVTLWAKQAEEFCHNDQPVVAIKGAKVSDFGGRSLSLMNSSTLCLNPDLPEAHELRGWFDNGGPEKQTITNLSTGGRGGGGGNAPWKVCREANAVDSAIDDKGEYFMAKVFVLSVKKDNCVYKACNKDGCNKKVIQQGTGTWRCEKCNEESTSFKYRLMLSVNFGDFTDNFWATAFQETAEILLGKSAEEVGRIQDTSPEEFESFEINFEQFIGKFRAKMENYNNETRKKINIVEIHKVNFAEYSKKLLQEIKETSS